MNRRLEILAVLAFALAGCRHVGDFVWVEDLPEGPLTPSQAYVIAPGDTLSIRVWNQEGMSGKPKVRADGKISLPFLNDVMAAGYTPNVLAQQLQVRLKEYLVNPVVTVSLEEIKVVTVSVLGEVGKPGQYPLEPGAGVLNALATGGGLTDYAHRDEIFVLRDGAAKTQRIRFDYAALTQAKGKAAEFKLQSGDVVVVQ
ncbi:MAG TPA: polysaccharide biosynthesis/export family protein [Myxococcaceae bacterium]|nr:polysaccharide biosynthesis/export family protein [Myxococcaceae bacterium]